MNHDDRTRIDATDLIREDAAHLERGDTVTIGYKSNRSDKPHLTREVEVSGVDPDYNTLVIRGEDTEERPIRAVFEYSTGPANIESRRRRFGQTKFLELHGEFNLTEREERAVRFRFEQGNWSKESSLEGIRASDEVNYDHVPYHIEITSSHYITLNDYTTQRYVAEYTTTVTVPTDATDEETIDRARCNLPKWHFNDDPRGEDGRPRRSFFIDAEVLAE